MIGGTCIEHWSGTYSANRDWFVQLVREGLCSIHQDDAGVGIPGRRSLIEGILKGRRTIGHGYIFQSNPIGEEMDCGRGRRIIENIPWVDCSNKSITSLGEVQAIIPTGKYRCCVNLIDFYPIPIRIVSIYDSSGFLDGVFPELRIVLGGNEGTAIFHGDLLTRSIPFVICDGIFRPFVIVGLAIERVQRDEYNCGGDDRQKDQSRYEDVLPVADVCCGASAPASVAVTPCISVM